MTPARSELALPSRIDQNETAYNKPEVRSVLPARFLYSLLQIIQQKGLEDQLQAQPFSGDRNGDSSFQVAREPQSKAKPVSPDLLSRAELDSVGEIDRLQKLNQQLRNINETFSGILNKFPVGIVVTDAQGRVLYLNGFAKELLGVTSEAALDRRWHEVFPIEKQSVDHMGALSALAPGQRIKLLVRLRKTGPGNFLEVEVQDNPTGDGGRIFLFNKTDCRLDSFSATDDGSQFPRFNGLVGQSSAMRLVFKQIANLAKSDITILIEGETGTGKELVARAIHQCSSRRDGPFIALNCAGLTESLLTSQLFGHKRGAFTGAISNSAGLLESANGGTLLLDEIGDMPMTVQTVLLRVLQEKEITRIGESLPRKIDVRVVAATHRNLAELVDAGTFRRDLLYRIKVAKILLPALRNHPEDIPLLASWFVRQLCAGTNQRAMATQISYDAMDRLSQYTWPGNVRELRSVIEVAFHCCNGSVIHTNDLPLESIVPVRSSPSIWHDEERHRITQALNRSGGNRAAAARLLRIGRTTLYRRIDQLGISE